MEKYDIELIKIICNTSLTMQEASTKLGIHFNTLKRIAVKIGCYNPNRGGKGTKRICLKKIQLIDILSGKYPDYQTFKLKNRLIQEGYKKNICEECNISKWNGKDLNCELDHIDGNRTNHSLDNLKILCPNCHSQTSTYKSKNIKRNKCLNGGTGSHARLKI